MTHNSSRIRHLGVLLATLTLPSGGATAHSRTLPSLAFHRFLPQPLPLQSCPLPPNRSVLDPESTGFL
jgi:hypothetical protein